MSTNDEQKPSHDTSAKRAKLEHNDDGMDPKQREILEMCRGGKNIFLTGVGGTGKTFLLLQIAAAMRAKYGATRVAVSAPTGVAAIQAGGCTFHSIVGVGVPDVVSDFDKCKKDKDQWRQMQCLIIDEVSMLEASYLDYVDATVREIRRVPDKAFGGIQLILSGDMLQLKGIASGVSLASKCPVVSNFRPSNIPVHVKQFDAFVFQTVCWRDAKFHAVELTRIFRQSEAAMIRALMTIRRGVVDESVQVFVSRCVRELEEDNMIKPTILYARNVSVDAENQGQLDALPSEAEEFVARDAVFPDPGAPKWMRERLQRDPFFKGGPAPERIVLKVGAQVILTQNVDNVLVNGSKGIVKHFMSKERSIEQLSARINESKDDAQRASLIVQLDTLRRGPPEAAYPVVLFRDRGETLCSPVEFKARIWYAGTVQRYQVPLKLAWALSMHKAQGTSLDRVQVDLSGCFAVGQCYVALSRARTTAGLQILGFNEKSIKADPMALAFHDALSAGKLDEFMRTVPLWFEPIFLGSVDANWLNLFRSSPVFRAWEARKRLTPA